MGDLSLCGWRLRSEILFPELSPWRGAATAPAIEIKFGPVPDRIENVVLETPFLQINADKTCRLEIPTVAVYLIRSGREIVVASRVNPAAPEIRNFIFGPVLGMLCHQRDAIPLHAAAVCIDGAALALAGPSRRGKSTLAAALARRGHAVLADDLCVIDTALPDMPAVRPATAHLRLWRDACEELVLMPDNPELTRPGQEKYLVSFPASQTPDGSVPLRSICLLAVPAVSEEIGLTDLDKDDAAAAVTAQIYGHAFFGALDTAAFTRRAASVAQTATVRRLTRRLAFENVDDAVRCLEGMHA